MLRLVSEIGCIGVAMIKLIKIVFTRLTLFVLTINWWANPLSRLN